VPTAKHKTNARHLGNVYHDRDQNTIKALLRTVKAIQRGIKGRKSYKIRFHKNSSKTLDALQ